MKHVGKVSKDNLANANKREAYEQNLEKAFELLTEACTKDQSYSKAFFLRGKCYYHMGDFQRALYDFSVAIRTAQEKKEPKKELAEYYNYAGVQHYELGQLEEALAYYEKAVENDKTSGMYHYNKGLALSRFEHSVHKAIESYTLALNHLEQPEYIYQARFNKGICLRRIGELKESIVNLKKAVELQAGRAAALNNLGLSQFENEEYEEALISYTKAIKIADSSIHYNNRGLCNCHFEKLDEAKDDFDKAIARDANDPVIYFNRGNVFLTEKNYISAHEDYDQALKLDPHNPKLWHSKGLAFQNESEKHEDSVELYYKAIEMYNRSLELKPSFISAQFHLGIMYHKTSQYKESLKCFSTVLEKIDNDKTVYMARGAVYADMGNHHLAIKDFKSAIALDELLIDGYFKLGMSKLATKLYYEAIADLKKAKEI